MSALEFRIFVWFSAVAACVELPIVVVFLFSFCDAVPLFLFVFYLALTINVVASRIDIMTEWALDMRPNGPAPSHLSHSSLINS